MRYRSINELEKFDFKDALVHKLQIAENTLTADLEAVIVQPDNSQNSNFTKSYAGDLVMTLQGAKLQKAIKEGYKYYDANDVLKEVVPDTVLEDEEIKQLLRNIDGAYLWAVVAVKKEENTTGHYLYQIGIDTDEETTYWLQVEFDEAVLEWERFMNRVQD